MTRKSIVLAAGVALAMSFSPAAQAQQKESGKAETGGNGQQQAKAQPEAESAQQQDKYFEVVTMGDWNYDELYASGWSAERLLDGDVYGPKGDEIGEVENILVNKDGSVAGIIAEVGGVWDIGDTHVAVPWNEVKVEQYDHVNIPVTQETVEDYSLFKQRALVGDIENVTTVSDEVLTGPRIWKITELLDDYVVLKDGVGYGYVSDLIFSDEAKIKSVVINPAAGWGTYGPHAYPYYGYDAGWDPGYDYYQLPYNDTEVAKAELFDYEKMNEEAFDK